MKFFKRRVIGEGDPPLLIRYILFRCTWFGIFLHKLCRSDHDRALHDHPWPFISIILTGGYVEVHDQTIKGWKDAVWRKPRSVLVRPAEWRHRLVIGKHPIWTLMIVGRRQRLWGFFTPKGWCWWRKYNPKLGICEEGILYDRTQGGD